MDEFKEVKIIAGLIIGLGVLAFGVYVVVLHGLILAWLAVLLAGGGVVFLAARGGASVYWAFKGPRGLYERDTQRLAALVDAEGQTIIVPPAPYPAGLQSLSYHNAPHIAASAAPALPAVVEADRPAPLPQAKSLYDLMPSLTGADKILLGFDEHGPVWLRIDELLSIAMAGNSGRGKSRALLWLVLQFLRQNIQTGILDGKGDLRKWIGGYQPVAYTPSEVKQTVQTLLREGERRLELASRDASATFPPLLTVIDELDLIEGRAPEALDLIEMLTKKTRSVNVHGIYSNQSVPADLVGGVATRGVIVSRICFYCDDEAARLLGVRKENNGQALLQRIGPPAPEGVALARTAAFGWKLLAFPFVPDEAIGWLAQGLAPLPPLPPNPHRRVCVDADLPQNPPETPPPLHTHTLTHRAAKVTAEQRAFILQQHAEGRSPSAIATLLWNDAHKNVIVRQVIEESQAKPPKQEG